MQLWARAPPPTYEWDADEGAPAAVEETRVVAEPSAGPSSEGAEREPSPPAAGEEMPAPQVLIRGDEAAAGTEFSFLSPPSKSAPAEELGLCAPTNSSLENCLHEN